ncbi:MAG TPA: hypothetical protein VHA52_10830, partial [Candidatus Babeliaceae bacterium]|nr:hypothetical protein [Candidatus Babeliaceae bacterium]
NCIRKPFFVVFLIHFCTKFNSDTGFGVFTRNTTTETWRNRQGWGTIYLSEGIGDYKCKG